MKGRLEASTGLTERAAHDILACEGDKVDIVAVDILDEDKLARKHDVRDSEVREVFRGEPRVRFIERGRYQGEDVYAAYGQTEEGRYLTVLFIYKLSRVALVLSARDMDSKERKRYGRK